jgi:ABC-type Na+ efflux pump permease subunit
MTSANEWTVTAPKGIIPRFLFTMRNALVITRREVKDSFRDWRIILPIVFLTFVFPFLSQSLALQFQNYLNSLEGGFYVSLIGARSIPFFLMVVGFFPISISLVIALETFVGEKERRSLEPLLSTPLSSTELYIGKTLAAMFPPLFASLSGMTFYLILSLSGEVLWRPPMVLLAQIYLLTIVQALVMVTGAVVVSSQTNSTRAANLLASFIILPMAFIVIGESAIMFIAPDANSPTGIQALWAIIGGMFVVAVMFLRVGNSIFNSEELLASTVDQLNIKGWFSKIWGLFVAVDDNGTPAKNIVDWYRRSIPHGIRFITPQLAFATAIFALATVAGVILAGQFPLDIPPQHEIAEAAQENNRLGILASGLGVINIQFIIWQNLQVFAFAFVLGLFSFGVLGLVLISITFGVIGYIIGLTLGAGYSPLFLLISIGTHGWLEIPIILLAGGVIFALGASISKPIKGTTVGHTWTTYLGVALRLYVGVVVPGLIISALIESTLTVELLLRYLGVR